MSFDPATIPPARRPFLRLLGVTLAAVYALILLGGIVRSTGAGMGCPDWPKCFGEWIPPTSEEQLPVDYRQSFLAQRQAKNARLARMLEALGMRELADQVLHEETVARETEFNARKTWTEYVNRLAGASIGILVLAVFLYALRWRRSDRGLVGIALATLVAVGFNGWTGSLVVSTHLLPWMVTFHMLLALLVIALLILLRHRCVDLGEGSGVAEDTGPLNSILLSALAAMVVQIAMGTQVREAVDSIALSMDNGLRETWVENLGVGFYVHRSFSLLLLALNGALLWLLGRHGELRGRLGLRFQWLFALTVLEVGAGAILAYFALPPAVQPLHLLLATLIFGLQFEILLALNYRSSARKAGSLASASS